MKKVRKIFCNHTPTLKEIQQRTLIHIARKEEHKMINQKELAKQLDEKYTTLNYNIRKLRKYGLIDDYNELTDRGIRYIRYFKHWDKTFSKKLRAHKIQVTIHLARCPKLKGQMFTPFTNNRYQGLKAEIRGSTVLFYSQKKAVVNLPDIYGNNDEEIATALNDSITQMIKVLEMEFPGLKVDSYNPARYDSIHIAILDSVFSELYILQNKSCFKGQSIGIDKSHGRFELEAESAPTAFEDLQLLVKVEDLVAENERMKKLLEKYKCPEMSKK